MQHISSAMSVELVRRAKKDGINVTAEATPHHIALTEEALGTYDTNFKMNPPLRTEQDRKAIIAGLRDGTLDCIATDHATFDETRREIPDGGLFIRDGFIEHVGPTAELPTEADEILDLTDHIILPGLVNTHHHFYQTLTRAVPAAQNANLFNCLKTLYPIWARLTPEEH